ncbi:membrane integrity-associated transporter subunit PqiC [Lonsdalea quercina]|uniref:ABC-type transport auxiliary lipoprotein component domain-containing protein n=1 Tax=Lonsdalea quercina TaxID=71657 RepID=A0A1H3YI53_9GAMM|nr:membrane integrity-associated transporter subunit PqiC [Lonsdalea quercina]SEA11227.1 hypothetical protein SAMN02982996_01003 [Lonsdalea quercina]
MMKRWTLALVLLLGACSSDSHKVYYQLPSEADKATASVTPASAPHLWVRGVALADSLSNSGIVYQTSDVRYTIASNNLWASPLDQQLQQSLIATLQQGLPSWGVVNREPDGDRATLDITVSAFQGRYDGSAVIRGAWTLRYQDRIITQPFNVTLPQSEDGYDALVKTLAEGWQQVAQSIVRQAAALS